MGQGKQSSHSQKSEGILIASDLIEIFKFLILCYKKYKEYEPQIMKAISITQNVVSKISQFACKYRDALIELDRVFNEKEEVEEANLIQAYDIVKSFESENILSDEELSHAIIEQSDFTISKEDIAEFKKTRSWRDIENWGKENPVLLTIIGVIISIMISAMQN